MSSVLRISSRISKKSSNLWVFSRFLGDKKPPCGPGSANDTAGDVPGLSTAVLAVPEGEVGPGASKDGEYKNPEYFSYNRMSYHEAEIEMHCYRNPQPSAKTPLVPN